MHLLPTLAAVAGAKRPPTGDGISFLKALRGDDAQPQHRFLHWEFHGYGGQVAVRRGKWKLIRRRMKRKNPKTHLFDLEADVGETQDVSAEHPEVVAELMKIMREARTESPLFRMKELDG